MSDIIVIGDTIVNELFELIPLPYPEQDSNALKYFKTSVQLSGAISIAEHITQQKQGCTYIGYMDKNSREHISTKISRQKNLNSNFQYTIQHFTYNNKCILKVHSPHTYPPLTKLPVILKKTKLIVIGDFCANTTGLTTLKLVKDLTSASIIISTSDPRAWHGVRDITFILHEHAWNIVGSGFKAANKLVNTFIVTHGKKPVEIYKPDKAPRNIKVPGINKSHEGFVGAYAIALHTGSTIDEAANYAIQYSCTTKKEKTTK